MVSFTECVIVETELKFNRKLQEANVDRSKGGGNFELVSQDDRNAQSSRIYDDIHSHNRSSIDEDGSHVGRHSKINAGFDG